MTTVSDVAGNQTSSSAGGFTLRLDPVIEAAAVSFTESADVNGQTVTVTAGMLNVVDLDTAAGNVTVTVSNVPAGLEFRVGGTAVTSFTLAQLHAEQVTLWVSGGAHTFTLSVTDGVNTTTGAGTVSYSPIATGKILWGDGSGNGGQASNGQSGGATPDVISGTAHADILFGDGWAGSNAGSTFSGYGGGHGGYGGGGAGATEFTGYGTQSHSIGGGRSGIWSAGTPSWLGPSNEGQPVTNSAVGTGGGVRASNGGSLSDPVAHADAGATSPNIGNRSVYDKVLWDLSQGTAGFGTGNTESDGSGSGNGRTNIDERLYARTRGAGADTLRGGRGNDWLMGGGGADVFQWRNDTLGDDFDGGTDYLVDFSSSEGDRIDLAGLLAGYTGGDVSNWVKLEKGLTANSPFQGGSGTYSRLLIDRDGAGDFATPEQTILFRADALAGFADEDAMRSAGSLVVI